jgi:diguanylate cyclase (GGDEF)-like protein
MDVYILIVDDDEVIRALVHEMMGKAGYKSIAVSGAEEAFEVLEKENIDVVITDIKMPGMDGLELTDRIKRDYDSDVIVMTGYADDYSYEEAVCRGASDFIFKPFRLKELILRLNRVLRERKIARERDETLEELKNLAITDGLTKLYNSRQFYIQLEIEVDRANRYHHPLSLLLLDLDFLKPYNDLYGHLEGDKVLARFGMIIRSRLRKMDSGYRYGGDEFTVILPSTKGDEALVVAERIRTALEQEKFFPNPGKSVSLTVSIGATEYRRKEEVSSFIYRADQTMYISKQKGGNLITSLFSEDSL